MLDNEVLEDVERFVEAELACRKHPGSSLSVIRGGEVVWAKGFGYADVDEKVRAKPETVYRCASVTKPVVTVGLLQLMEKGKFDLDDEVNSHLDVKIRGVQGEEPTIRDLLTHRSGMPTRVPPIYLLDEEPLTMRGYIESAAWAVRPRGEKWAYCNTAYMIVGYLIELFSGVTYDRYVAENVLEPLEMSSSAFTLTPEIRGNLAQGYKRAGGPENALIPVSPYLLGTMPEDPAGSLYSTVLDLANLVIMNMGGGRFKGRCILKEETVKEMHRLQAPSGNSRSGMGLTWFYSIHDGHIMLSHTGGLPDLHQQRLLLPPGGGGSVLAQQPSGRLGMEAPVANGSEDGPGRETCFRRWLPVGSRELGQDMRSLRRRDPSKRVEGGERVPDHGQRGASGESRRREIPCPRAVRRRVRGYVRVRRGRAGEERKPRDDDTSQIHSRDAQGRPGPRPERRVEGRVLRLVGFPRR